MNIALVRKLNDVLRSTFTGGRVMITASVDRLPNHIRTTAIHKTKAYRNFTQENDPLDEHNFGSFEVGGHVFYWKIDYYDAEYKFASDEPDDPEKTIRVLTLMLESDYQQHSMGKAT